MPRLIAVRVEVGTWFPAARTSQGKVLLAALPPDDLAATLALPSRAGLPARGWAGGPPGQCGIVMIGLTTAPL